MKILFFQYPSCSTCKKAAKWLKDHDIDIESKHIVETPPTVMPALAYTLTTWSGN